MPHSFQYSSVFFATFSRYEKGVRLPTNGMVEPILSYFLPKAASLLMVDTPHVVSDTVEPFVEEYKDAKLLRQYRISRFVFLPLYLLCKIPSKKETRISYKLRDFFSVLWVALGKNQTYDLFIGLESVYALAGIVLKKLGRVRMVVYYVSDYAPVRYRDRFMNVLYVWLDRFCVTHADYTWDVSPAMLAGRVNAGLPAEGTYRVINVPNGLFPGQISALPVEKRRKYDVVYMGIMQADMGPDLAIKAFAKVRKTYPAARLHMVGGTKKDIAYYRKIAKRLGLGKSVRFYGFIASNETMADIVRHCAVGLAPYRAFADSLRWYGDAGKIRQYTAAGLPVVTTHVPPLGRFIVEKGAGIMTDDTVAGFAEGILRVLSDPVQYGRLSRNARKVSQENTWDRVYDRAIRIMAEPNPSFLRIGETYTYDKPIV